jgi:hypothetical protein
MNEERFWWTLLVRAQEQKDEALSSDPRDMDEWSASRAVEMQARRGLVKLGLNLDELMPAADEEFLARYHAVRQREQDEKDAKKRRAELVKAAEALLARAAQ